MEIKQPYEDEFTGTVTSVSVVTANGISGTVANSTTTPAITLTLGDITPTSVTTPTINGGTAANNDITIQGTTDATRTTSYVLLQPTGGNVGIGTTGPATTLHVLNDTTEQVRIEKTSNASTNFIIGRVIGANVFEAGYSSVTGDVYSGSVDARNYVLRTNNVARTTIDTSGNLTQTGNLTVQGTGNSSIAGNVGIGTTSPAAKLEVDQGNVDNSVNTAIFGADNIGRGITVRTYNYNGGTNTGGALLVNVQPTYAQLLVTKTGSAAYGDIVLNAIGGNVGIGTTAPTAYLHLKAGTATANTAPIKLTSGVVNTIPVAGCIEFDGTDYFLTI